MRKARIAALIGLLLLGLLVGAGAAGLLFLKQRYPEVYRLALTFPQSKRTDLIRLPANAPPPPRGYSNGLLPYLSFALGRVKPIDIQGKIAVPEGVIEKTDIEYGRVGERALLLDLYTPERLDRPAPGLVFIHGGGWTSGNKRDYKYYTVRFAKQGYVVATIGYRFAQEAPFPACVEDAKCAVRWMRENAAELHVNPDKIAVIGGSAGGYLALMVGYTANVPELEGQGGHAGVSSAVAVVVDLYGPTDLTTDYARNHPTVTNFLKKPYAEAPELYALASPITHVNKHSPPTLIFQGTLDDIVPTAQSDMLAEKLKNLGAPYWYDCLDGFPHTMDVLVTVNEHCQFIMNAFFDKFLQGKPIEDAPAPKPLTVMERIEAILGKISDLVWGPPMLIMLFGTHIFLTIRLRLIQRFTGKAIRLSLQRKREGPGEISHFGALTTALAATVGTGNIVGVATAVATADRAPCSGCG